MRSYVNGEFTAKYSTTQMSREEFESNLYNTIKQPVKQK